MYIRYAAHNTSISHPFVRPPIKMPIEMRQRNSCFPALTIKVLPLVSQFDPLGLYVHMSFGVYCLLKKKCTKWIITMNTYGILAESRMQYQDNNNNYFQYTREVQIEKGEKKGNAQKEHWKALEYRNVRSEKDSIHVCA